MKRREKLAAVLVMAVLLAALPVGGCRMEEHEKPDEQAKERKELLLWTYYETDAQKAAVSNLVEGFNQSQEEYLLTWEYHGPLTEFNKRLAIEPTAEQKPDIVIIDNPDMKRYAKTGELEDLTEYITQMDDLDTYYPEALDSACFGERYYGLPFCCNNVALIYNEELFQEKGMTVPQTWEEFLDCAVALTENDRKGFAMSAIKGEQSAFQILPFILATGEDMEQIGGTGTEEAFAFIRQLIETGAMAKECVNWSQNDVARKFIDGECAMMENGPWVLPALEQSGVSYGIARLPYLQGMEQALTGVTGGENLGVIKGKDVEGAIAFMQYYNNEEERMLEVCMQADSLPPKRDVAERMLEEKPEYEIFEKQMETSISRTSCRNWTEITDILSDAQFFVVTGQMTPKEACAYICEQGEDS